VYVSVCVCVCTVVLAVARVEGVVIGGVCVCDNVCLLCDGACFMYDGVCLVLMGICYIMTYLGVCVMECDGVCLVRGVCFIQGLSARKRASGDEIVHFQRHGASDSYWQFKYDNEPEIWYRRMLNGDRVWQNTEKQKKSKKAHKPAKVYPGGVAHAPMRCRTLPHTKGVLSECGKTETSMWDVLRLLMEPEQRSVLIDDVMTPYMRFKLHSSLARM
jgi:hypothetical protein